MTAFACCGLNRGSVRRTSKFSETDSFVSSAASESARKSDDVGAEHDLAHNNESLDVHQGSPLNIASVGCSQDSPVSLSRRVTRLWQSRVSRKTSSIGRYSSDVSSHESSLPKRTAEDKRYELYDHERLVEEVMKLRRALEATHSELVVTENELRNALIQLAQERDRHQTESAHQSNVFRHLFHSPKKRPIASVRKRSGSCPSVPAVGLPLPAACIPVVFSTINTLVRTSSC